MKFIIISILVLAFILAPIIALKPRGRQGRVEKMRLQAREQGATFSMRRLPALKTELEESKPLAVYSIPPGEFLQMVPEWILRRTAYVHDLNFFREWDWANEQRPPEKIQKFLLDQLTGLPSSVVALSAGSKGIAFFWTEEGDATIMMQLIGLLKKLKQFYQPDN